MHLPLSSMVKVLIFLKKVPCGIHRQIPGLKLHGPSESNDLRHGSVYLCHVPSPALQSASWFGSRRPKGASDGAQRAEFFQA